jgi:two-component system response regulator HydG
LVVDDQEVIRELCGEIATSLGFRVSMAPDGQAALQNLEADHVDILLTDLKMPGMSGLDLLERVKEVSPLTEVVIMTAFATVPSAVQAMRLGAYDYLTKPFNTEEVGLLLERLVAKLDLENENRVLREQLRQGGGFGGLLGTSPPMQKLFKLISKVSQNHYPVLIQGESGTGKELVARSIHDKGPLANKPFLPIDCGSLVPTLIESELFGYVRGAFTGAVHSKQGLLEAAQGGSVFLDEIGEMPIDLQSKFLRALQEKEVRPVGGSRRVKINARVIAATNRDLDVAVQQGTFRKDLYFRLNVVTLRLPPLRERKGDIPALVSHFIDKFTPPGRVPARVSEDAMAKLTAYDWPGNVRELENAIERAVALGSGPVLQSGDLTTNLQYGRAQNTPARSTAAAAANGGMVGHSSEHSSARYARAMRRPASNAASDPASNSASNMGSGPVPGSGAGFVPVISRTPEALNQNGQNRIVPIAELEKRAILSAIEESGGDKLLAARLLGIGKTTLYRKLKEYAQQAPTA